MDRYLDTCGDERKIIWDLRYEEEKDKEHTQVENSNIKGLYILDEISTFLPPSDSIIFPSRRQPTFFTTHAVRDVDPKLIVPD